MLHRLWSPHQFLWVSFLQTYFLGKIFNELATTLYRSIHTTPSIHHLRLRLLGYLIIFSPLAFISQCQCWPDIVLSSLVLFLISMHFTALPEIPFALSILQFGSFYLLFRFELWNLTTDLKSHLYTFYAESFWITLASFILPLLLAQRQPMLIP